jgi:hypothetical protein
VISKAECYELFLLFNESMKQGSLASKCLRQAISNVIGIFSTFDHRSKVLLPSGIGNQSSSRLNHLPLRTTSQPGNAPDWEEKGNGWSHDPTTGNMRHTNNGASKIYTPAQMIKYYGQNYHAQFGVPDTIDTSGPTEEQVRQQTYSLQNAQDFLDTDHGIQQAAAQAKMRDLTAQREFGYTGNDSANVSGSVIDKNLRNAQELIAADAATQQENYATRKKELDAQYIAHQEFRVKPLKNLYAPYPSAQDTSGLADSMSRMQIAHSAPLLSPIPSVTDSSNMDIESIYSRYGKLTHIDGYQLYDIQDAQGKPTGEQYAWKKGQFGNTLFAKVRADRTLTPFGSEDPRRTASAQPTTKKSRRSVPVLATTTKWLKCSGTTPEQHEVAYKMDQGGTFWYAVINPKNNKLSEWSTIDPRTPQQDPNPKTPKPLPSQPSNLQGKAAVSSDASPAWEEVSNYVHEQRNNGHDDGAIAKQLAAHYGNAAYTEKYVKSIP